MEKAVEELEKKNKELEKSKKILELQLKAKDNLVRLMQKQMEVKSVFYNNAFQSLMSQDEDESKLLLHNNEKIVVAIGSKRARTSIAAN
ncbi:hypothetical protein AgCh_039472 [Apium graveolens]